MSKRAWYGVGIALLLCLAIGWTTSLVLKSRVSGTPAKTADSEQGKIAPSPETDSIEKRHPTSVTSPQETYRKALEQEDQGRITPTWEELRKNSPREF